MPPTSIDGTDITGATIDGTDVTEITVDGQTVFSGIPASVVLQYFATTYSQGDGTWEDDAGDANMSLSGDFQEATLSDGAESIDSDGSDDHGLVTMPSSLESSGLTAFSVEFALEFSDTTQASLFGQINNGSQLCLVNANQEAGASFDAGNVRFLLQDVDGDRIDCGPDTNPNLDDGNRHDVSFVVNDAATNDVEMLIDGTSVTLTFGTSEGPDNFEAWDRDMAHFARNNAGTIDNHLDIEYGAIRWHDQAITQQTIDDY